MSDHVTFFMARHPEPQRDATCVIFAQTGDKSAGMTRLEKINAGRTPSAPTHDEAIYMGWRAEGFQPVLDKVDWLPFSKSASYTTTRSYIAIKKMWLQGWNPSVPNPMEHNWRMTGCSSALSMFEAAVKEKEHRRPGFGDNDVIERITFALNIILRKTAAGEVMYVAELSALAPLIAMARTYSLDYSDIEGHLNHYAKIGAVA